MGQTYSAGEDGFLVDREVLHELQSILKMYSCGSRTGIVIGFLRYPYYGPLRALIWALVKSLGFTGLFLGTAAVPNQAPHPGIRAPTSR